MKTVKPYTPIQYIIGKQEFCGLDLVVDESVLIPRPETEVLVETVIDLVTDRRPTTDDRRILDLCTGSGNIAISLTKPLSNCKIIASDISEEALNIARKNAARNGVSDRIKFVNSDLFDNLEGKFDIIVSNPPYVARDEFPALQKEVLMEPRIAIDGGGDGLDFYRKIIPLAPRYLREGGYLVMEIGFGQAEAIKKIIGDANALKFLEIKKDQYGIDRIIIAKNG